MLIIFTIQKKVWVNDPVDLQWNLNHSEQRECSTLLFGSIFKHQGYLYGWHIHHKIGIPVECDTELQWNLNRTQTRVVNKLIVTCSL
jgi:hypothetical protein